MLAAANGAYVKWALENGASVPNAALWNTSITTYEYLGFTKDGPTEIIETTREFVSGAQLAGSLGISDYTGVTLPMQNMLASETITKTINSPNGGNSKVAVARRIAWGLTQEGNQTAASVAESGSPAQIQQLIDDMGALISDGIEVRTSSNGSTQTSITGADGSMKLGERRQRSGWSVAQARPSVQELMGDAIDPRAADGRSIRKVFEVGNGSGGAVWTSPMDGDPDAVSLSVSVPLSSDDWIEAGFSGDLVFRRGGATPEAQVYGDAVMSLKVGAAWGLSIMGEPWRLPSRPMDPLYITFNSSTNCYRMDGMSWSFDGQGMAVGADTLLSGTVGEPG